MKFVTLHLLFLATLLHAQDAPRSTPVKEAPVQWEYSTVVAYDAGGENERLAKLGSDGWELVSVVYVDRLPKSNAVPTGSNLLMHLRYYFKRPKAK